MITYTIYGLVDPFTGLIRYVGITKTSADARFKAHLSTASTRRKSYHVYNWIRKLSELGKEPVLVVIETTSDRSRERFWIHHYGSVVKLTNVTGGGEGSPGYPFTDEHKRKISEGKTGKKINVTARCLAAKYKFPPGVSVRPDVRRKISNTLKGHQVSQATRDRISKSLTGLKRPPEVAAKAALAHVGIKHPPRTEEAKARMRASALARHAREREARIGS